jgi:hypothetical protein
MKANDDKDQKFYWKESSMLFPAEKKTDSLIHAVISLRIPLPEEYSPCRNKKPRFLLMVPGLFIFLLKWLSAPAIADTLTLQFGRVTANLAIVIFTMMMIMTMIVCMFFAP